MKDKLRAFAFHLLVSSVIIAAYLGLVYYFWYPQPYFDIEHVWDVIRVVILVDVFLGPLCTFIVYRRDKPTLRMDLAIIFTIQILALLWGASVTYRERPQYLAFVNGMFTVVSASHVDQDTIPDPALRQTGWGGPKMVYVALPFDDDEFMAAVREDIKKGIKLAYYARFYRDAGGMRETIHAMQDDIATRLRIYPDLQHDIDRLLRKHGGRLEDYMFFPVEGRQSLGLLVLRRADDRVVDAMVGALK